MRMKAICNTREMEETRRSEIPSRLNKVRKKTYLRARSIRMMIAIKIEDTTKTLGTHRTNLLIRAIRRDSSIKVDTRSMEEVIIKIHYHFRKKLATNRIRR
jgi:hypothetical protein